eukprot:TRINITY_DN4666_c0_g1_i3.p1 TRINITY_DN4666_c0_g1~~TRINITY_DN4666_c0_g1_i3.p1  ORF type:complete len:497 (+),score=59.20 TRINITY_DN4666_c0_g1_i3:417-1907(+)
MEYLSDSEEVTRLCSLLQPGVPHTLVRDVYHDCQNNFDLALDFLLSINGPSPTKPTSSNQGAIHHQDQDLVPGGQSRAKRYDNAVEKGSYHSKDDRGNEGTTTSYPSKGDGESFNFHSNTGEGRAFHFNSNTGYGGHVRSTSNRGFSGDSNRGDGGPTLRARENPNRADERPFRSYHSVPRTGRGNGRSNLSYDSSNEGTFPPRTHSGRGNEGTIRSSDSSSDDERISQRYSRVKTNGGNENEGIYRSSDSNIREGSDRNIQHLNRTGGWDSSRGGSSVSVGRGYQGVQSGRDGYNGGYNRGRGDRYGSGGRASATSYRKEENDGGASVRTLVKEQDEAFSQSLQVDRERSRLSSTLFKTKNEPKGLRVGGKDYRNPSHEEIIQLRQKRFQDDVPNTRDTRFNREEQEKLVCLLVTFNPTLPLNLPPLHFQGQRNFRSDAKKRNSRTGTIRCRVSRQSTGKLYSFQRRTSEEEFWLSSLTITPGFTRVRGSTSINS